MKMYKLEYINKETQKKETLHMDAANDRDALSFVMMSLKEAGLSYSPKHIDLLSFEEVA